MRLVSFGRYWLALIVLVVLSSQPASAVVPGTGTQMQSFGDDFEDTEWKFVHNFPKSSKEIDEQVRNPNGYSVNGKWGEGLKRGQPDIIERVPTPAGGLPGSNGALMMRSLRTGRPGRPSWKMQQDDLIIRSERMGFIPVSSTPNAVVRVYMPPFEEWENATGSTFGVRASVIAEGPDHKKSKRRGLFSRRIRSRGKVIETYYPGFFIQFNSETDPRYDEDSAVMVIRGDSYGRDFNGPVITQTGWWTFGMSFTPDGRVAYYASPGVDDLTAEDHIATHFPQGVKVLKFKTVFFNVVNRDNGRDWSTEWIIDDPQLFVLRGLQTAGGSRFYRR